MRTITLLVLLALLSLAAFGQSGLTGGCQSGGTYPSSCSGGEVTFSGAFTGATVHITVTNSAGKVLDDGDYAPNGGVLSFTENLSVADTYTIAVNYQAVMTVTTY